jgi:hypothetical protein
MMMLSLLVSFGIFFSICIHFTALVFHSSSTAINVFEHTQTPARAHVIYGQVFRRNSDEFCDAKKLHECTFMPFSVVE